MDQKRFFTKRNLLTAGAILIGILLIALILALSGRGRPEDSNTGGEDSAYPYSWAEYPDGSVAVRLSPDVPEGYAWFAGEYDGAIVKVAQTGGKRAPEFTLTSVGEGDALLRIDLAEAQGAPALASLSMIVDSAGSSGPLTVSGLRMEEAEGVLQGRENGISYLALTDDDGNLRLRVSGAGSDDWGGYVKTPGTVSTVGVPQTDTGVSAKLTATGEGDAAFVAYSASRGVRVEFEGTVGSDGIVRAQNCTVLKREGAADEDENRVLAELVLPRVTIPEGAENVAFSREGLGNAGAPGSVSFTYEGISWSVTATETGSFVERMDVDEYDVGPELRTFLTEAGPMYAYLGEASRATAWCDAENCSYYIECRAEDAASEVDPTVLIETANIVMGGNQ